MDFFLYSSWVDKWPRAKGWLRPVLPHYRLPSHSLLCRTRSAALSSLPCQQPVQQVPWLGHLCTPMHPPHQTSLVAFLELFRPSCLPCPTTLPRVLLVTTGPLGPQVLLKGLWTQDGKPGWFGQNQDGRSQNARDPRDAHHPVGITQRSTTGPSPRKMHSSLLQDVDMGACLAT